MVWHETKKECPKQGQDVLLALKDGSIHEGRFLANANYKVKNVNKFFIYKISKYVDMNDVVMWRELPFIKLGA